MKPFYFILPLFLATGVFAQTTKKFYNYQWAECDIAHARFVSVVEHTDSGWHRLDYYIHDLSLQMEGWYEDSACKTANGKFIYTYPGKKLKSTGRYLHNKKQGLWLSFHLDGSMADSVMYEQGNRVGIRMGWHISGYTSDSAVYNADGSGVEVTWFDNGNPSSAGMLTAGYKKNGRWKFYHKNGHISATEIYDHGKLLEKEYFDSTGQPLADTTTRNSFARFKGGVSAWLKYLDRHLTFPPNYQITNSDEAAVVVTMTIDEEGNVRNAYVSTPFYPAFDRIALKAVVNSPKWIPAMNHNRTVANDFAQPVVFSQTEQ